MQTPKIGPRDADPPVWMVKNAINACDSPHLIIQHYYRRDHRLKEPETTETGSSVYAGLYLDGVWPRVWSMDSCVKVGKIP